MPKALGLVLLAAVVVMGCGSTRHEKLLSGNELIAKAQTEFVKPTKTKPVKEPTFKELHEDEVRLEHERKADKRARERHARAELKAAERAARELTFAEHRPQRVHRLLYDHGAVGMTGKALIAELGHPSHTQEIAGQPFWYYVEGDTEYQLLFSGGVVHEVNRY